MLLPSPWRGVGLGRAAGDFVTPMWVNAVEKMEKRFNVAVLVGSLRKGSFTRMVAKAMIELAPPSMACEIVEIGHLPLYNEDLEADPPLPWQAFRASISNAHGVLFATPEYNRSIPGGLKNAIDVGSRPYGKSVFQGKAGAVVSVSPGAIGGFGGNIAVRNTLIFLDVPTMQQPEAYIGNARDLFDGKGKLKAEATRDFLTRFMRAFAEWIELIAGRALAG